MGKFHNKTNGKEKDLTNDRKSIPLEGKESPKPTNVQAMDGQVNAPGDLTDEELVARYKKTGDTKNLEILLDRHDRLIFGAALSYVPDKDEIQDIKQEMYEKLYVKLIDHTPTSFKPWLRRLVRNYAYDKYVRKKKPDLMEDLPDVKVDILSEQELNIDIQLVRDCMESLRPNQRMYLELKFFRGMKDAEIRKEMNLGPTQSRGLYDRAKAKLKQCLEQRGLSDEFSSYFS